MTSLHASDRKISISEACSLFGRSRQAYYKSIDQLQRQVLHEHILLEMVRQIRTQMPRLGCRKLHHLLSERLSPDLQISRDGLFALLGRSGLLLRRRRWKPHTTDSHHPYKKYPNLIVGFVPTQAGQLYVCDITYVEIYKGVFYYLSIVTDAYSRKIVGWWLNEDLKTEGCIKALKMALKECSDPKALIHHSDRGSQYCSAAYIKLLKQKNVSISMTQSGDPLDNAIAERVNGILKTEWLNHIDLSDILQARRQVAQVIELYNNQRPHMSLNMLTPNQAHQKSGMIERKWKSYYKPLPMMVQTT